jgi:hypothetical protein
VYERQNGPLPGNGDKVGEWLRNGETACSSDGQALPGSSVASESNATRCPAQGSTRLRLGIVGWPAQLAQPTIAESCCSSCHHDSNVCVALSQLVPILNALEMYGLWS